MPFRGVVGKTKGRFVSEKRWLRERELVERRINKAGQHMRQAIRARDQARDPKVKAKWQRAYEKVRPQQMKELQARARLEHQGTVVRRGRWVEVTLRFRRTIPKGDPGARQNRLRMLKVQAEVTKENVTKAQIERAVENAIRSGRKTKGIKLRFTDWEAARDRPGQKVEKSKGRLEKRKGESLQLLLKPFAGLLRHNAVSSRGFKDASEKRPRRGPKKGSR